MDIDRKFLPVYKNATILLRPKTGLKDMFLELDPGTNYDPNSNDDEFQNGDKIPVANTAPDTNVDQILAALDGDTRAYLRLLLVGGGQGLNGRGKDLGKLLGSLGPINRGLARAQHRGREAQGQPRHADPQHEPALRPRRPGRPGHRAARLGLRTRRSARSPASRPTSSAPSPCSARRCGPPGSRSTKTDQLATVLGPAMNSLRPFARKLKPVNDSLGHLAKTTYDPSSTTSGRSSATPASRSATCGPAAKNLVDATPRLTTVGEKLNKLFNMAAYNPNGAEPPGHPRPRRGLPLLARLAGAMSATAPSPRRTPTASTATSTWWPPATRLKSIARHEPARAPSPASASYSERRARHDRMNGERR